MSAATQKAETARHNGSKSKGPITEQGKLNSSRNAILHGRRAEKLTEFVPPESALLSNEDRQQFYALFDQNLANYRPANPAQRAVVREITDLQWVNFRLNTARHALLSRELHNHAHNVEPQAKTAVAYEAAMAYKSMAAYRQEYNSNARLIIQLRRSLAFMQQTWPAQPEPERKPERTNPEPTQPIENTEQPEIPFLKELTLDCPWTNEVIAMYTKLYPHQELSLKPGQQNPAM